MIRSIQEHLFSVLRDIVYTDFKILARQEAPTAPAEITNMVFRMLRNAHMVLPDVHPILVVCWGGHVIPREEYDYAKQVGYELGLRGLDIVTGCGIGAIPLNRPEILEAQALEFNLSKFPVTSGLFEFLGCPELFLDARMLSFG